MVPSSVTLLPEGFAGQSPVRRVPSCLVASGAAEVDDEAGVSGTATWATASRSSSGREGVIMSSPSGDHLVAAGREPPHREEERDGRGAARDDDLGAEGADDRAQDVARDVEGSRQVPESAGEGRETGRPVPHAGGPEQRD